jgi:hypothetical protein
VNPATFPQDNNAKSSHEDSHVGALRTLLQTAQTLAKRTTRTRRYALLAFGQRTLKSPRPLPSRVGKKLDGATLATRLMPMCLKAVMELRDASAVEEIRAKL